MAAPAIIRAASSYVTDAGPFPPARETMLSAFQAGHGWVASGTGSQADSTTEFTAGLQSLRLLPPSDTSDQVATRTFPALNLSGSYLRFQVLLGGVIGSLRVRVASGNIATDYAEATIWSSSIRVWAATGQWEHVWVPRGEFTTTGAVNWSGITTIQFRVSATGAGTVNCYLNRLGSHPDASSGCVVLAFDDGLASVWNRARTRMASYGWPGTAFIIADMIDTGTTVDARGAMTTAQLQELQYRYGWEIGSHAFALTNHNAAQGFVSVTPGETDKDFYLMRQWLDRRSLTGGQHFAWPKGETGSGQATVDIARRYFSTARSTRASLGARSHERAVAPLDRHRVRGWSLNGLSDTTSGVQTALTQAAQRREMLVLVFHEITAGAAAAATDWSAANFDTVLADVAASGLPVVTYGQAMAGF